MKKHILLATLSFTCATASGQILNEDASGKSSILVKGTSVSINITEAQAQISHIGTFGGKTDDTKTFHEKLIWGFDVKAKSKSGVSDLFSDGKITPESSLSLLFGKQFTKFFVKGALNDVQTERNKRIALEKNFQADYMAVVSNEIAKSSLSTADQKSFKTKLDDLTIGGVQGLDERAQALEKDYKDPAVLLSVQNVLKNLIIWYSNQEDRVSTIMKKIEEEKNPNLHIRSIRNRTNTFYARLGGSATGFTQDNGAGIRVFDTRFTEEISRNFYGEVGLIRQWQMNYLGINVGYANLGNFDKLTSADYKYSAQDTMINSGKLSSDKSFKGYSGAFGYFGKIYLAMDYQHLVQLEESKYLSIGPYTRINKVFSEADLSNSYVVLGASLNYLDGKAGKFLGGIYIQSDDISGKTEPNFGKSIKFGLIVKFSLSTLGIN